jgi:hypothetical protein
MDLRSKSASLSIPVVCGAKIKGIAFRSVLRTFEALKGKAAVDNALAVTSAELGDALRYGTIVASSWYPIEWYRELFAAVVSTTNEGERIVNEIGRESARLDMTGIYKAAFRLLSPQIVFNLSARLFSNYYDTGTVAIVESRKGFVQARWAGCKGFDRNLWVEVLASSEMYLELAGAKNIRMRVQSGAGPTDESAMVQAHWT